MLSRRLQIIGLNLLILTHFTQSFVLLTANIEDLKKFARKFFSEPLAEKIVEFIAKASGNVIANVSEENEENAGTVQKVSDNEMDEFHKIARLLPTSKRYKKQTRRTTSTMSHNEPVEYVNPSSSENLRHKQNYQKKIPKSEMQNIPEDQDREASVQRGKPLVVVNQSPAMYKKLEPEDKPQEKSKIFFWEKKPAEIERQREPDNRDAEQSRPHRSDNLESKHLNWNRPRKHESQQNKLVHFLNPKVEYEKQRKRKKEYERKKHASRILKKRPRPRQPAEDTAELRSPKNIMPMPEIYHPNKPKSQVLLNIQSPDRQRPVLRIQDDEFFSREETNAAPKSTSGYAVTLDRLAKNVLRGESKGRFNDHRFALLNAEDNHYVIPPIVAKTKDNDTVNIEQTEETKPTLKIVFPALLPSNRASPAVVNEVTTEKEKNDFDQYDVLNNHTPAVVVATSGQMSLRRAPQQWWEKKIPN